MILLIINGIKIIEKNAIIGDVFAHNLEKQLGNTFWKIHVSTVGSLFINREETLSESINFVQFKASDWKKEFSGKNKNIKNKKFIINKIKASFVSHSFFITQDKTNPHEDIIHNNKNAYFK